MRKQFALCVIAVAVGAACDSMFVHDARSHATLALSVTVDAPDFAASGAASAISAVDAVLDKANIAAATVVVPGSDPVTQTVTVAPGQTEIRINVPVAFDAEQAVVTATFQLRRDGNVLFTGTETVTMQRGVAASTNVHVMAVPQQVDIPTNVQVAVLHEPMQLQASAAFATGDALPVVWSADSEDIVLTPDGRLTALQNGTYGVTAVAGVHVQHVEIRVFSPPAAVVFVSGAGQTNYPGSPLPVAPVVRVTDASGHALRGVEVTFTADSAGIVSNATVFTNGEGLATLPVWTLGNHGPNTLRAAVAGLAPAVLTTTTLDPCLLATPAAIGATVTGRLVARQSCQVASGRLQQRWAVTLTEPTLLTARLQSSDFAPFVGARFPGDGAQISGQSTTALPGVIQAEHALPAGEYVLFATTTVANAANPPVGAYTLTIGTVAEPQVGCFGTTAVVPGSAVTGTVTGSDCEDSFDEEPDVVRRLDGYSILLTAGQTVTVTATADFPMRFSRWVGNTWADILLDVRPGQPASFTVTSQSTGFHSFYVIAEHHEDGGQYSLNVTGSATGVRAAPADLIELSNPNAVSRGR